MGYSGCDDMRLKIILVGVVVHRGWGELRLKVGVGRVHSIRVVLRLKVGVGGRYTVLELY